MPGSLMLLEYVHAATALIKSNLRIQLKRVKISACMAVALIIFQDADSKLHDQQNSELLLPLISNSTLLFVLFCALQILYPVYPPKCLLIYHRKHIHYWKYMFNDKL